MVFEGIASCDACAFREVCTANNPLSLAFALENVAQKQRRACVECYDLRLRQRDESQETDRMDPVVEDGDRTPTIESW